MKQSSNIKVEQANSIDREEIDHHPIPERMTDKLINTLLSNNIDKVPKFAGKPDESVNKWLTDITNELDMVKISDDKKRMVIQTFLLDDARKWFINNMNDIPNWSSFVERIQRAFSLVSFQ